MARKAIRIIPLIVFGVCFAAAARAQGDPEGDWVPLVTHDNNEDVAYGNYSGMPINNAARLRAESWSESILSLDQWQCKPHGAIYFLRGPGARLHIQREYYPVTGQLIGLGLSTGGTSPQGRMIVYMDGRSEPSELAPHTWFGFSKGTYEGGMVRFVTSHVKEDTSRRLGVPSSSKTVLNQFWIRHGDYMVWFTVANDPVYLTEPMLRSMDFHYTFSAAPVVPAPAPLGGCTVVEESDREYGTVPNLIPAENKFVSEYANQYHLPVELTLGGAKTMYPEYQRQIIRAANEKAANEPKK